MGLGSTADDELSPEDQEIVLIDRFISLIHPIIYSSTLTLPTSSQSFIS